MRKATGAKNASAAVKRLPAIKGPPKVLKPCSNSSLSLVISPLSASVILCSFTRWQQLIPQVLRNALKPECISAAAQRAKARALTCSGQTSLCVSYKNSIIASESQTAMSFCTRHGTLPLGEKVRNLSKLPCWLNGTNCSINGMLSCIISSQGRNDQDE